MDNERIEKLIKKDEVGFIYTPLTKKALKISFEAHKDAVDKGGLPYVYHPFYLATRMDDEYSTIVALLHDVVEDTPITFETLSEQFPRECIDALKLLTHNKEEFPNYLDYVRNIKSNPIARKVKLEDLKHNSVMLCPLSSRNLIK